MEAVEDDVFRLSTGRTFYANNHILGIADGSISEGYDGGIEDDDFTQAERLEVAAYAIAQWINWASTMPERAPVLTGAAAFAHALHEDLQDFAHLRISNPPSWVKLVEGWVGLVEWQWLPSDIATHPPVWVHIGRERYRCLSVLDFGRRAGIVIVGEPSA